MAGMTEEQIRKDLAARVVRLGDELDRMITLTTVAREALQNEMFGDGGFAKVELRPSYMAKIRGIAATLDTLVQAKIRWDKNQAAMAKSMTAEEEKQAVRTYVRSLPDKERYDFIRHELAWHQERQAQVHPSGRQPTTNKIENVGTAAGE